MYNKYGNFINGAWNSASKDKIEVINPFNEEILEPFLCQLRMI